MKVKGSIAPVCAARRVGVQLLCMLLAWLGMLMPAAAVDLGSYKDRQTFRGQAFFANENIWKLNAAFAERFRMPPEWVSNDLHGIEAAAFRVVRGFLDCGLGGKNGNCRRNTFCLTDVCVDEGKYPLPWGTDKQADWRATLEPASMLWERGANDEVMPMPKPWKDPKTGVLLKYFNDADFEYGNATHLTAYQRKLVGDLTMHLYVPLHEPRLQAQARHRVSHGARPDWHQDPDERCHETPGLS